jgi:hypothetical protein
MHLVSAAIVIVCVSAAIGDSRVSINFMRLIVALLGTPSQAICLKPGYFILLKAEFPTCS